MGYKINVKTSNGIVATYSKLSSYTVECSDKDGFVSSIIKPLIGLGIVMKLFGGEKKLTAKERVDRMMGRDFGRNLIEDEQLRAPKGGYAEEYKKIQRRREGETAKEQEGGVS